MGFFLNQLYPKYIKVSIRVNKKLFNCLKSFSGESSPEASGEPAKLFAKKNVSIA
jgi:hypothetical protein